MHVSLALVIGVLVAVGAFLVYLAVVGATLLGLNAADEAALAAVIPPRHSPAVVLGRDVSGG
jgi:hypothetical protein